MSYRVVQVLRIAAEETIYEDYAAAAAAAKQLEQATGGRFATCWDGYPLDIVANLWEV